MAQAQDNRTDLNKTVPQAATKANNNHNRMAAPHQETKPKAKAQDKAKMDLLHRTDPRANNRMDLAKAMAQEMPLNHKARTVPNSRMEPRMVPSHRTAPRTEPRMAPNPRTALRTEPRMAPNSQARMAPNKMEPNKKDKMEPKMEPKTELRDKADPNRMDRTAHKVETKLDPTNLSLKMEQDPTQPDLNKDLLQQELNNKKARKDLKTVHSHHPLLLKKDNSNRASLKSSKNLSLLEKALPLKMNL